MCKKMKIAYVIHNLGVGGAETIVTNYLIALKEKGMDVVLIEFIESNSFLSTRLSKAGIEIISLFPDFNITNIIKKAFDIIKFRILLKSRLNSSFTQIKPDIVHFHTNIDYLDTLNLQYNKVFYTFHTAVWRSINYPSKKFKNALSNSCIKGLKIVAISKDIKKEAEEIIGKSEVIVIPNGIDINAIRRKKVSRDQECLELGIPMDAFIVGHVGRFHEVKNHEKILGIFKEITLLKANSVLLLIGDGDRAKIDSIKQLAKDYNILDKVKFLGLRSDVHSIMSVLDCLLLPSRVEGFPLVLVEAQALGVRCIASDVVPEEEILNDNCFELSINKTDLEWARLSLDCSVNKRNKDIMSIDINNVIERHISEYEKAML